MDRGLAVAVAGVDPVTIEGRFERHTSMAHRKLSGSAAGGRWGPQGAFPVLYLGRPTESVIVEAYRHLVDPIEGMRPELVAPRRLLLVDVQVTEILDLRRPENRETVGLSLDDLMSGIEQHEQCQAVGQVAHQLGLHGIIAPAATGLGETLALLERRLPADEHPELIEERLWEGLPADPRRLHVPESGNGVS